MGHTIKKKEGDRERKRQRVKFEMEIKDECFSKCLAQIEPKYPKVIKKIKIKTKNNNCQKAIITNIRIQYPIYYLNKKPKLPTTTTKYEMEIIKQLNNFKSRKLIKIRKKNFRIYKSFVF